MTFADSRAAEIPDQVRDDMEGMARHSGDVGGGAHVGERTPPARFSTFAEATEAVAATTLRNEKADRMAAFFNGLDDADLARAARFAAGRVFPLADQRTVNVGGAAILRAIEAVTGIEGDALRSRLVALGDAGDVAFEAMGAATDRLTLGAFALADAEAFFSTLAATPGAKARLELAADRLRRLSPLEGRYLVRLLSGDLRIGLLEGGVEAALARWTGTPVADVQRANMLTGDVGETAVLARHGRLGEARFRLFHPLKFMLATAAETSADVARQMPQQFAVEDKFDGIRAQAHVALDAGDARLHGVVRDGVRVALFSRTLDEVTPSFPELVAPLGALAPATPSGLVLDGEIVPVRDGKIRPFQDLQRRLGRKAVTDAMTAEVPVAYVVYDVLVLDGEVRLDAPYRERQALLDRLAFGPAVRRSAVTWLDGAEGLDEAFDAARARGNEGLMVKGPDSLYKPGRRGRDWLKVKKALAMLDVVVTAVEVGSGRRRHLLSDFTFAVRASADDPTLLNVGKAYSGLTDAELTELTAWFEAHTRQSFAHGKVRVVDPEVVIEVAFDRVQPSSRHKSGYALRFPRIVRLRDDKPVAEIDTLDAVRRLAEADGAPDAGGE